MFFFNLSERDQFVDIHKEGNYPIFSIYLNNIVLDTPMVNTQPIFMSKVSGKLFQQNDKKSAD